MPRFIVTARRRGEGRPVVCQYLSVSGFLCYGTRPERVAVFPSLGRADEERAYFVTEWPEYDVNVEAVPVGVPLSVGLGRAVLAG